MDRSIISKVVKKVGGYVSANQLFILKQEIVGVELPYLIKLNREESRLEIFKKCGNEKLYSTCLIRKNYNSGAYVVFEKGLSVPCIFGRSSTPTPEGVFHIEAKSTNEYISTYYPNYDKVKFFGYLVIFEDYFIHSDLYTADQAGPTDGKSIGCNDKATSGCIRVSQDNLAWLIKNIDVKTLIIL